MIRLCIVGLILGWGYHEGGMWGLYTMLLISGAILPIFAQGMSEAREQRVTSLPDDREDVPARRGRRVDPTRPTHEDYAAMITDNFKRK